MSSETSCSSCATPYFFRTRRQSIARRQIPWRFESLLQRIRSYSSVPVFITSSLQFSKPSLLPQKLLLISRTLQSSSSIFHLLWISQLLNELSFTNCSTPFLRPYNKRRSSIPTTRHTLTPLQTLTAPAVSAPSLHPHFY